MIRDFAITDGIYLVQEEYELDLHNNFDFQDLDYSIEQRTLNLKWKRSNEDWAEGVIILGTNQKTDPSWPAVLDFMFGAVIIVQSESARAKIRA